MTALTDEVLETICDRIASGEAMSEICRDADMPATSTVYLRMANDEVARSRIARAREAQQDAEVDKCIELADAATVEDHQVVKLRIWARQWRASKLAPKRYGDKQTTEITGADGGPVEINDTQAAAKIAALLSAAKRRMADDGEDLV